MELPSNDSVYLREAVEGDQKYLLPLLRSSYMALADIYGEHVRPIMEQRFAEIEKMVPDIVTLAETYGKVRLRRRRTRREGRD